MMEAIFANLQQLIPYAHLLAELQVDIHARTASKLPSQCQRLQHQIQSRSGLAENIKVALLRDLDELQDDNAICHGDLHPENILLTAAEPVIIDWVDATQGSPLAEVARTTLLLRASDLPHSMNERRRQKVAEMRYLFDEAYIERHTQMQSISREAIARWVLLVAAARLSEGIGNREKTELLEIVNAAFP